MLLWLRRHSESLRSQLCHAVAHELASALSSDTRRAQPDCRRPARTGGGGGGSGGELGDGFAADSERAGGAAVAGFGFVRAADVASGPSGAAETLAAVRALRFTR